MLIFISPHMVVSYKTIEQCELVYKLRFIFVTTF